MSTEASDFKKLEDQMQHLTNLVETKAAAVRSIQAVAAKVRGGRTWFTAGEKSVIENELRNAGGSALKMCENGELCAEIAYTQQLVNACGAYEVQAVANVERVPAVEKPYEIVQEWTGYEFAPGSGSEPMPMDNEVRQYAADDPEGEYQLWCNGRRQTNYTEDWKKKTTAERDRLQAARAAQGQGVFLNMSTDVDVSVLLGRLNQLTSITV